MAAAANPLARRIERALGRRPAELVIRGARLLNTATGGIARRDIAIGDGMVLAVGRDLAGERVIEARGRFAVPGFIDAHVHLESSMVLPQTFERAVLARGTTTVVADPHELANVLGAEAFRYLLACAERTQLSLFITLSSCVPASPLETSGARLELEDLLPFADHPSVLGLAELMDFPGVLGGDPALLAKAWAFQGRHIDGHAPLLSGAELDAYLVAGPRTDHECSRIEEAQEKLEKGMFVFLREGSVAKNVAALAPVLGERNWMRIGFCTDDRNPVEILEEGHIDHALRRAVRAGAPVIACYRAATLGAATAFGLRDRGVIAPGYRADLVLVDDLEEVAVSAVICGGRVVEEELFAERDWPEPPGRRSVRRAQVTAGDFKVTAAQPSVPVIGVRPFSLITDHLTRSLPLCDGALAADPDRGILKVCVLERHGRHGRIGRGFVEGFGPMRGALCASIGHDSHNLVVVGADDADMALAVNRVVALQGGAVLAAAGRVLAELPLSVAGLMSEADLPEVAAGLRKLRQAARGIGCILEEPLMQLAFLPLAVIPHLKITDQGYVTASPDGLRLLSF